MKNERAVPFLPGILIDPEWLSSRLQDPDLRVVDLREPEAFATGHIPGAVQLDLAKLGATRDGCDNVLLPAPEFERLMAHLGISNSDAVVAYDDQWGLAAARLVWALHRYGHAAASVLDGGWDRWHAEGKPTAAEPPSVGSGAFQARPHDDVHADLEWIAAHVARGGAVLLDTRTAGEFVQGHVPGAANWDWLNAVPPGSWDCARDPEALRTEWAALGVDASVDVAVYCRSGMRAAHTYVVLKHAGLSRVRLYDGSWQEWSQRGERSDDP